MQLPSKPYTLPAAPQIITGPKTLVAVLTFYPILELNKKTGKAKTTLPLPQTNQIREVFNTSLNTLATSLTNVLHNKPGARQKAARLVNWARRLPEQEIAGWREHGRQVAQQWLNEHDMSAPMLEWAHVDIVCFYPNFIRRDVHGLSEKEAIDGISSAGFFTDDSRVISVNYGAGGVDADNPRVEFFIYSLELTREQEALLVKQQPVKNHAAGKLPKGDTCDFQLSQTR